jgi:hypothetical protein
MGMIDANIDRRLILKLVACILLRVLEQFQGFRLTQHCFNSCLVFYLNNRYIFRSYDHLQAWIALDGNPEPDIERRC